jgi:hypothetical protein
MYGEGVDVFRVVNGKITDHWDGSPPATVTIKAHPPGTAERVMSGLGPPGPGGAQGPGSMQSPGATPTGAAPAK